LGGLTKLSQQTCEQTVLRMILGRPAGALIQQLQSFDLRQLLAVIHLQIGQLHRLGNALLLTHGMNHTTSSHRPQRRLDVLPDGHQLALDAAMDKLRQPALGWTTELLNGLPKVLHIDWNGDPSGPCHDFDLARGDGRIRLSHQYDTYYELPPNIPADLNIRLAVPFWLIKPTPAGRALAALPLACGLYHPHLDTMTVLPLDPSSGRIGYCLYLWHPSRDEELGEDLLGRVEQYYERQELKAQHAALAQWPLTLGVPQLSVIGAV
jgi:hypothetical protein